MFHTSWFSVYIWCLTFKVLNHPHNNDNLTVTELKVTPFKCFFCLKPGDIQFPVTRDARKPADSHEISKTIRWEDGGCWFGFITFFFNEQASPLLPCFNWWTVTVQCFLLWFHPLFRLMKGRRDVVKITQKMISESQLSKYRRYNPSQYLSSWEINFSFP